MFSWPDGGSVGDGRRQVGRGKARNRARARLNWFSQSQRWGRCKVRRVAILALSRCDGTETRLFSMSVEIMRQRDRYYRALQVTQSGFMDMTNWLTWFLNCLTNSVGIGEHTANQVLSRRRLQTFA